MTIADFFANAAAVVEGLGTLLSGWLVAIVSNPIILICVLIPFSLLGIRIIKRLMSV